LLQEKNIKLVGADALSINGFTQVPNYMLKSPRISPGAKLTYAMLLSYAWGNDYCFPGQETLAKDMRTTKGLDGKTLINVTPKYLLVGPDSESDAERLLASIYPATTDNVNIYASKLNLLVEPRLEGPAWYIFADPSRLAAFQYGYLSSAQGVQIQRSEAWSTLGMRFRAWLDFGAGWLESRAAYLNEGE